MSQNERATLVATLRGLNETLSRSEIALLLGVSEPTVARILSQARLQGMMPAPSKSDVVAQLAYFTVSLPGGVLSPESMVVSACAGKLLSLNDALTHSHTFRPQDTKMMVMARAAISGLGLRLYLPEIAEEREFYPHSLIKSGATWYARGRFMPQDGGPSSFGFIVVSRTLELRATGLPRITKKNRLRDADWETSTSLMLEVGTHIKDREAVQKAFEMKSGVLTISVKKALIPL